MAAIWGAAIGAAGSLIGNAMSQSGQQNTNQANMAIAQMNNQFAERMSDTAMQRRVVDLKQAGLNPYLAVQEGGASTPLGQPVTMQNPSASWANLGPEMNSAVANAQQGTQIQSNVQLQSAQAAKANADASLSMAQAVKTSGVDTDVAQSTVQTQQTQQALNQAMTVAQTAQAGLNTAQINVAYATLPKIQAEIANIGKAGNLMDAQAALARVGEQSSRLTMTQFQMLSPYIMQSAINASRASGIQADLMKMQVPKASADSSMWSGNPGLSYINAVMNMFHIGANITQ